jgi:hypothetical protein
MRPKFQKQSALKLQVELMKLRYYKRSAVISVS